MARALWNEALMEFHEVHPDPHNITSLNRPLALINLEYCVLIWLDQLVDRIYDYGQVQKILRSTVDRVLTFEDIDECDEYITTNTHERIIFIVNGPLGEIIVPRIHHLPHVSAIYIFCLDRDRHLKWTCSFAKVTAVVTSLDELVPTIQREERARQSVWLSPLFRIVEKSTSHLDGGFIHSQIFLDFLLQLKRSSTEKNELIQFLREHFTGNTAELQIIDSFEKEYTEERALLWYTKDTFFYRMLNQALRNQNIDLLILFRFFMQDIWKQLIELQKEQSLGLIRVYRGQLMSSEEVGVLMSCEGQMVSMHSFISTSLERDQAMFLLGNGPSDEDMHAVLFSIDLDSRVSNMRPFANISRFSAIPNESEILLTPGSVFYMEQVSPSEDSRFCFIQMILSHPEEKAEYEKLWQQMLVKGDINFYDLAQLLDNAGKLDEAERCYRRHMVEYAHNDHEIADCHLGLGIIFHKRDEYEEAVEMCNSALLMFQAENPPSNIRIGKALQVLGNIGSQEHDFEQAMYYYESALELYEEQFGEDSLEVAGCLGNIAYVFFEQKEYEKSRNYTKKALSIRQKLCPTHDPVICTMLENLANTYSALQQYDIALQHYELVHETRLKRLPSDHPDIANTYFNMGQVHGAKGDYAEAISLIEKALIIYHKHFIPSHPNVLRAKTSLKRYTDQANSGNDSFESKLLRFLNKYK